MPMNTIFVLEPKGQSLLTILATLATPGDDFPSMPRYRPNNVLLGYSDPIQKTL